MAEETEKSPELGFYVDTGLAFKGYPILLGPRQYTSNSRPHYARSYDLTRLDRYLFKYCEQLYTSMCNTDGRETLVDGAAPWPEGKGPKSPQERAQEIIVSCLEEKKAQRKCSRKCSRKWYQFWK